MLLTEDIIFLKEFGLNLRRLREKNNISQSQIAFELGTSTRQYQRIEYGEINTGLLTLKRLSKIFNISIIDLINIQNSK